MKEKVENLGWFSRMEELVEALEDLGLEVLEANREYVVVGYEEDEETFSSSSISAEPRTQSSSPVSMLKRCKEVEVMKRSLSKMNTNQLRDLAVILGADRKKLYGTSKQSLIFIIHELEKGANHE